MLVRVLVRVGLVAVVVSLCLISSELVLRFLAPVSDPYDYLKRPESFNHYVKSWPGNYHLQTEAEPSLPGIEERAHFTTNKVGFRGGEIKRPKPKNEFRVFLIGGSTTECMYIDDDQAIDRALGRDLNRLLPNVLSARVFNTGRGGLKSDDHVAMLAQRIVHLEPDVAVVLAGANDLFAAIRDFDYLHVGGETLPPQTLFVMLRMAATEWQLGRRVYYSVQSLLPMSLWERQREVTMRSGIGSLALHCASLPESARSPRTDLRTYERNLLSLIGICRAHSIDLIFMTQVSTWNTDLDPPIEKWQWMNCVRGVRYRPERMEEALEAYNGVMRVVAERQGLALVDLVQTIPKSSEYFYDDMHFNVNGARRAAAVLAPTIAEVAKRRTADAGRSAQESGQAL